MNVLFLDIDTLRPDHMSCYGYPRRTTPNLDQIAAEGVRFENCYCSDAPCLPSRAGLVSGEFGIKNGIVGHGGSAADRPRGGVNRGFQDSRDVWNFHNIFRRAGMYTASVSTFGERHSAWWFQAGFQEIYNEGERGLESGEKIVPYVLDWLERNRERKDWYLHVHFWDPHTPYRVPESFGNPFENEPLGDDWIDETVFRRHRAHVGPHSAREVVMFDDRELPQYPRYLSRLESLGDVRKFIDGYDCGVAYADYLSGLIFDRLKELGLYEDTAVIIMADHGENLGELGLYAEHATADLPCCHVPLIIKWPGAKQGHVDRGLHYQLDLTPTVADLLGVEKADYWDGKSLKENILEGKQSGRESLVLSQMAHVCQRSARFGDWLYIRTYHDGFHLFDNEMLYHVSEDVHEQKDVKEDFPQICALGAKIILDWHDRAMLESSDFRDPMWTVLQENGPYHTWNSLPDYIKRLEQTDRAEGARRLREKYTGKGNMQRHGSENRKRF
ncbi:MAG: sulfatase-like hydrolase/transferase [Lachnospiraceae bacterium]|nr:sulfatase-like hydrolase/transferase [Lachnospiraceae bacterium]